MYNIFCFFDIFYLNPLKYSYKEAPQGAGGVSLYHLVLSQGLALGLGLGLVWGWGSGLGSIIKSVPKSKVSQNQKVSQNKVS